MSERMEPTNRLRWEGHHEFNKRGDCLFCGTSFAAYVLDDYDCRQEWRDVPVEDGDA